MRIAFAALVTVAALASAATALGAFDPPAGGNAGAAVTACDTDGLEVDFAVEWDPADGRYEIGRVTVSGVSDACDGQTLTVRVADAESSLELPTGPKTAFELPLDPAPAAEDVGQVHVVISN